MITHSPPTSNVCGSNPGPLLGKVDSFLPVDGLQFTVQNLDQLYVLVSSAHKTTQSEMTCTLLKPREINPKQLITLP